VRFFVAGSLCFGFGHELSVLRFAVPAAALVINAALGVDPDFAAGLSGGNLLAAGFVALELVPVALACAFAKAGEMATVSIRQKASIHGVSLL
jgi:hypothetical protein